MKKLLLRTALTSVGFATAAHAGSITVNGITITQAGPYSPGTFDNNSANDGDYTGNSWAIYDGKVQPISFVAGADTTGVTNGTFGYAAAPDHETSCGALMTGRRSLSRTGLRPPSSSGGARSTLLLRPTVTTTFLC